MGKPNSFMQNNFSVLLRVTALDRSIYDWITCARYHVPSLSINDCAKSFLHFNKIDEGELSLDKINKTYSRIQKEVFEELKSK